MSKSSKNGQKVPTFSDTELGSARRRLHNKISFTFNVTRFPCIAIRLLCSNMWIRNDSEASWRARRACGVTRNVCVEDICENTSRTRRWNGNFWIKSSVDFWYFRISRRATVPGRNFLRLRTFPVVCFFVLFPSPVNFRDVSLVLVMIVNDGNTIVIQSNCINYIIYNYRIMEL